jgi:hypothetical protein
MLFALNPGDQMGTFLKNANRSSPTPTNQSSPAVTPTPHIMVTRTCSIWRFENSTIGSGADTTPGIAIGGSTLAITGIGANTTATTPININITVGTPVFGSIGNGNGLQSGGVSSRASFSPPLPLFTSEGNRIRPFSMTLFVITITFTLFD